MNNKKIFIFMGTNAELIKLVPVIREFNNRKIRFTIISSGQNDIRFNEFNNIIRSTRVIKAVTPKSKKPSIFLFVIWAVRTFFSLVVGMRVNFRGLNKSNSLFILHGDTVSSLMGSLVASVYGLTIVHIESGLSSSNFMEPFPEEICRHAIARLADIHFCPNAWSKNNLRNVGGNKIITYENTLIETFWASVKYAPKDKFVRSMIEGKKQYFVLIIHRQEHVLFNRDKTQAMMRFVLQTAPKDLKCLFLIHDISSNFVHSLSYLIPKEIEDNIVKLKRLPYNEFMNLLQGSQFLITDGGSNQEEMYYMGKPCLLLRNKTERIEGINQNVVLSNNNKTTVHQFMLNYRKYIRSPIRIKKRPSKIIVDYLLTYV